MPREAGPALSERELNLAQGLRALASMVDDYLSEAWSDGHGGVSEPDESDPVCHLWNAASAVNDDPDAIQVWLYAEHEPVDGHDNERDLIAAGKILAGVPDPRRERKSAMGEGGPCLSCGGNDGYGPAPHHKPGCYFASDEDANHAA
jgi:hypothetical protein